MVDTEIAVYAAAALLATVGLLHVGEFFHDDAFISLRYGARLLAGEGLSWNPGERVEGFTHPLWLAQVATLGALGVDLPTAAGVLGVTYLVAMFVLWRCVRAAPLLLLLLATQPGLLLWTVSGLETTGFSFWLALGAWLTQELLWADAPDRRTRTAALAGAALGAAALIRPEGAGAGVVALALLAASRRWRPTVAALLAFAALAGSYELFRIAYFGAPLPNTAYAKLDGLSMLASLSGGFAYLRDTIDFWMPSAAAAAMALGLARGRRPNSMLLIAAPVLLALLLAGGDHMPGARLTVPLAVVLVFTAAIAGRTGFRHARVVTGLVLIASLGQLTVLLLTPVACDPAALVGEHVGRFLQTHLPAGATVATATAGSTPYFAPSLHFIDTLGLNDRHIARRHVTVLTTRWQRAPGHLKGDGAYVLHRAPDVIILGPAEGFLGQSPTDWFLTDFELLGSADFRARYRPYRFLLAIAPELIARQPLPGRVDHNPFVVVALYLRSDSPAAAKLASFGSPIGVPPRD